MDYVQLSTEYDLHYHSLIKSLSMRVSAAAEAQIPFPPLQCMRDPRLYF